MISVFGLFAWLTSATEPCGDLVCWQVAPTVCLVEQQQQICHLALSLTWQSKQPQNLCIYLDEEQLNCWSAKQQGAFKQPLTLTGPARLELRQGQEVILQQQLTVLSRQPERRRRLVTPWSLF